MSSHHLRELEPQAFLATVSRKAIKVYMGSRTDLVQLSSRLVSRSTASSRVSVNDCKCVAKLVMRGIEDNIYGYRESKKDVEWSKDGDAEVQSR